MNWRSVTGFSRPSVEASLTFLGLHHGASGGGKGAEPDGQVPIERRNAIAFSSSIISLNLM
jgi:hypothetical protein